MAAPNYLLQKPSGYYFRYQLPDDIKPIVNQSELRYSLRTRSIGLARSKARLLAGTLQSTIRNIRGGNMATLTDTQIAEIIRKHIKQTLEADEQQRLMDSPTNHDPEFYRDHVKALGMVRDLSKQHLAVNNIAWVEESVDELLKTSGVTVDRSSIEYRKLCREYMKADTHIWEVIQKRQQGDYSDDITPSPSPAPAVATEPTETEPSIRLSELTHLYFEEGKREESWTEKTIEEVQSDIALNIRIIGDIPITTFNHRVANRLKDALIKLPPNINKKPKLKDLPIEEILAMDHPKVRSIRTVNKGIQRMGMVLKYGVRHGYIEKNYMEGLSLKEKKGKGEKRDIFNDTDLAKIFGSTKYREDTFRTDYNFWLPPLALFTGARLTELSQLHLEDFIQEEEIWCIYINNDADDKRIKTQAARRLVPLHPFLLDLGIIERVEKLKEEGHTRMFPDLNWSGSGYGQTASKWFAYYRKTIGISGPDKVFHSFRHTAISKLAHNSVDEHIIKAIAGHAENTVTYGVYVKDYPVKRMYEAIVGSLNYDVDLSHLKGSKYAG